MGETNLKKLGMNNDAHLCTEIGFNMIAPRVRSNYSIQQAYAEIPKLVNKAIELGFSGLALTDIHSISGHVEFKQYVDKINKKRQTPFRALLGMDILTSLNGNDFYVTAIAKNKKGWHNLIKILHQSKLESTTVLTPVSQLTGLLTDCVVILDERSIQYVTREMVESWGSPDVFVMQSKPIEEDTSSVDFPSIGGNLVMYADESDAEILKIIMASRLKCTFKHLDLIKNNPEASDIFFNPVYYLRTDTDPNNTTDCLADLCEDFSISSTPNIPQYKDQDGNTIEDVDDYLTNLCRKGWKDHNLNEHPQKDIYLKRIKYELDVIKTYKLSNYFLIIWDIANYIRRTGYICGLRGSAVGCLISYLIGISKVDPVCPDPCQPYDPNKELLFSRFLNKGRLAKGNVSLPDIDLDVPIGLRSTIISYIKDKYGHNCVGHIITFSRMDGKMAIKEVFRILDKFPKPYEISNYICSFMVDTSKVQDELELEKEDDPNYNIINYCIDNVEKIKELSQEYSTEFELAIKLANCIKNTGKHAAGIVIASKPLHELFPVSLDKKTGEFVVALEMADAETVGAVKYDILGVAAYDKIYSIDEMIRLGLKEPIIVGENNVEDNED